MNLSIVLPCYNEEKNISYVLRDIQRNLPDVEIILVDNNSTDDSVFIAESYEVKIVHEKEMGYGSAVCAGIKAVTTDFVLIMDCDGTYCAEDVFALWGSRSYGDLIIGNRLRTGSKMKWLHKVIGVPVLSRLGNMIYKTNVEDWHSGMRLFRTADFNKMKWTQKNFNFASEMIVNYSTLGYTIYETDITLQSSPVQRTPKLNTFRDGFRCLKYLLRKENKL